jgi:hypothetical protein
MAKVLNLQSIKLDLKAQNDGEWRPVPIWQGVRLKCRSLEYQPFKRAREDLLARLARRYDPDPAPEEIWLMEFGALLAEHILLDWDGFGDAYNDDLAAGLLCDPAWKLLRDAVLSIATSVGRRELEFVEQAEKNSDASSAIS